MTLSRVKLYGLLLALTKGEQRILLTDVETLTLRAGEMTTGRRMAPIPQLRLESAARRCQAFSPRVVQCSNRGTDGLTTQWECKGDLDSGCYFSQINISCEGYEYPEDKNILAGSCGLIFALGASNLEPSSKSTQSNTEFDDALYTLAALAMIMTFLYYIISMFTEKCHDNNNENRPCIPPAGYSPRRYEREFHCPRDCPPPYPGSVTSDRGRICSCQRFHCNEGHGECKGVSESSEGSSTVTKSCFGKTANR